MRRDERLSGMQIAPLDRPGLGDRPGGRLRPERVGRRGEPAAGARGGPAAAGSAAPARLTPRPHRPARWRPRSRPEPRLAGFTLEALAVSRGVVELRGWVTDRAARALAARVALRRARHRDRDQQHPGPRRGRPVIQPGGSAPPTRAHDRAARSAIQSIRHRVRALRLVGASAGSSRPTPRPGSRRSRTSIMMPPPNVTAVLHMGHGLNNTVQDVLVRFERMRGRRALWLPGTDHAGIATQNVVERLLAKEGLDPLRPGPRGVRRAGLGLRARDRRRDPRAAQGHRRVGRLVAHLLHASTRTLARRARGVRAAVRGGAGLPRPLHHQLVPALPHRALQRGGREGGDDGKLWHLRYPLADGDAATSPSPPPGPRRCWATPLWPCTRRTSATGTWSAASCCCRSWTGAIPIVADDAVDPAFGTGAVKITPAHDPNDFEIGRRHDLPMHRRHDARGADQPARRPSGSRGSTASRRATRVVAEFEAAGLLEKVEPHRHAVGHCYRCDTVVEPRLSDQWFVRMEPLAAPALAGVPRRHARILPERRGDDYVHWLEGIRDWSISRQLWWGHRIPVWYCEPSAAAGLTVSRTDLDACPACGGPVRQDEDVLDTWFSSWLVPFSTLGWPDEHAGPRHASIPATPWSPRPRSCSSGSRG